MRKAKFNTKKFETPDGSFDSKKEYYRFCELKLMEQDGLISNLQRQVKFDLIPSQKISSGTLRGIYYVADFVYMKDGQQIIEDVKPTDRSGKVSKSYKSTNAWKEYMIKKKLVKYVLNCEIMEV